MQISQYRCFEYRCVLALALNFDGRKEGHTVVVLTGRMWSGRERTGRRTGRGSSRGRSCTAGSWTSTLLSTLR